MSSGQFSIHDSKLHQNKVVVGEVATTMTAAVELLVGVSLVCTHYHQPTHIRMENPCIPRLLHTHYHQFTAPISEIYPDCKNGVHFTLTFVNTTACHVTRDNWNAELE